jgi:hypothetical protein
VLCPRLKALPRAASPRRIASPIGTLTVAAMDDGLVVPKRPPSAKARPAAGIVSRAGYSPHSSSARRASVFIASRGVRAAADEGPSLRQRLVADRAAVTADSVRAVGGAL